ncbi:MAG: hypothetical protein IJO99_03640 [Ruminococcus sp.]|nr:hypothetical protein [Ruminococcus sp.]
MLIIVLSILLPIVFCAVTLVIIPKLKVPLKKEQKGSSDSKGNYKKSLVGITLILVGVLTALSFICRSFMMNDGKGISIFAVIITSALPYASAICKRRFSDERLNNFLKKTAVWALIFLTAEVIIFNGKSFDGGKHISETIGYDRLLFDSNAQLYNGNILINGNGSLVLNEVPKGTEGVILRLEYEQTNEALPVKAKLSFTDDNFSQSYVTAQTKYTKGRDLKLDFSFEPYGEVHSLKISFSDVTKPFVVRYMRAVGALPFEFSFVRFMILLAVTALIIAIKEYKLYRITYNEKKTAHVVLTLIMTVVCTWSAMLFYKPQQSLVDYNPDFPHTDDQYYMIFDAFEKDQLHIDYEVDERIDAIENVYDFSQREQSDAFVLWDFALYQGKYYVYFGAVPVLTFHYPFYFITGKLPPISVACAVFGTMGILFMCLTLTETVKALKIRANLILLLLSMPASVGALGIYDSLNLGVLYSLPILAGLCYLLLSLFMGMKSITQKNRILKLIMLFVSGASLALCAGSRPTIAIGAVVLIPLFIGILRNNKLKLSDRISQASAFLVPLIAGGCMLMWYNYARFDSPFEFGATYQITVSSVSANKVRLSDIPLAVYHYFLNMPRPRETFPFIEEQYFMLNNYGAYKYIGPTSGAFMFPFILLGVFTLPLSLRKKRRQLGGGVTVLQRNAFILCGVMGAVFLAIVDYSMAGVQQRYVTDIMPPLILAVFSAILLSFGNTRKHIYRYTITAVSMAVTFVLGIFLTLGFRLGNIHMAYPNLYEAMEELIIFWR